MKKKTDLVPDEIVMNKIYLIRGQKVMLDMDLAELYGVETKRLKEAVKRNAKRFPEDFMFELTKAELQNLRSQFASSRWGGVRYSPLAFTENGVAMLSSILNSEQAILVNISIIRVFTKMRQMLFNKQRYPRETGAAGAKSQPSRWRHKIDIRVSKGITNSKSRADAEDRL